MKLEIVTTKSKNTKDIITSIIIFVFGALLFTSPDQVIKFASYILGGLFAIYGIYSFVVYAKTKQNASLISGILGIIIAIIFLFLADVIETAIRYLTGAWILFSGLTRLISSLSMDRKDNRFVTHLIISVLLVILGFYIILVSNLFISTIGILIMIYSGIEIAGYVYDVIEERKSAPKEEKTPKDKNIQEAVIVTKDKKKNKKSKTKSSK